MQQARYWCAANCGKIGESRLAISIFWGASSRTFAQMPVMGQNFFKTFVTTAISGPSIPTAANVAIETGFKKDEQSMTISSRIAL
jgi:hypothetical protein